MCYLSVAPVRHPRGRRSRPPWRVADVGHLVAALAAPAMAGIGFRRHAAAAPGGPERWAGHVGRREGG